MQRIVKKIVAKALLVTLKKIDDSNESITTYRVKPLVLTKELQGKNHAAFKNVGILIQGQLIPGVTWGICKRYKTLYPNSKIILSTWEETRHSEVQRIEDLGIPVIQNKRPETPGPSNINLQIISTKKGLDTLAQMGVDLVLKNRSDGMLSSDYLLEYLQFLFANFSDNGKRIIIPVYNTFLFRLYSPTDQFQFGSIVVLQEYWNCPLAENARMEFRFAESYLVREYLSSVGRNVTFSIRDSLSVYRDYFVIADNAELGLVLNKGARSDVSNRWATDGFPQAYSEIHFWNWLELGSDMPRYEKYYENLPKKPDS